MTRPQLDLGDLFRIADQFHDSALLHFAHSSGLFELTVEPHAPLAVAERMGWVPRKTEILLNALVAVGLLAREPDGRYRNAPVADKHLVKAGPDYMGGVVEHQRLQWSHWSRLGEVMVATEALPSQQEQRLRSDAAANEAFHTAMRNLSSANIPAFLALPQVSGRKHVIDLAGGHGTYLAAMAREHPELTGEVWDLAGAERLAQRTFREYGCSDRCRFFVRDIGVAECFAGARADVVMLNDCLHYFAPDAVVALLSRARDLLAPGGSLIVATRVLDDDGASPADAAGFSLHMMLNTADGGVHPTSWIADRMRAAGLRVEQRPLDPLGRNVLLVGETTGA